MKRIPYRTYLDEQEIPKYWYNLRADMPEKIPPLLHPGTRQPVTVADLETIFPVETAKQELDETSTYIPIPEPVLDYYRVFRPSPLIRAYHLEKALQTPAEIYFKFEGNNTSGSHKLNSAIAQAYYAKAEGLAGLTTETGAGQWGTALAEACALFDLPLSVYMVRTSYEQKPFRASVIRSFGAEIFPSPSNRTEVGRRILEQNPDSSGSLGIAISEALEVAAQHPGYRYSLGSVLNLLLLHQSIIGLESEAALKRYEAYPDIIVGCAGGGSNLGGLIAPFMRDKIQGKRNPRIIAVEPSSCPSLTRGKYTYDFCDAGKMTPLAKMYTLGNGFMPDSNHAGGLRYHGMSTIISKLYDDKMIEAVAVGQKSVFEAAVFFSKVETILPAPESAHAIYGAIQEAIRCRENGEKKTILFGLTGTGYFDLSAYTSYLDGKMDDSSPSDEALERGFATIPQ